MTLFLSVILTILKGIGILLLVVLGIILFVLLLLLFSPFRYQGYGELKHRIKESGGGGQATWLWGLVGGGADYLDRELKVYLKIFGRKKYLGSKSKQSSETSQELTEEELKDILHEDDEFFSDETVAKAEETPKESAVKETEKPAAEPAAKEEKQSEKQSEKQTPKKVSLSEKLSELLSKITGSVVKITGKAEEAIDKLETRYEKIEPTLNWAFEQISDERNQEAVGHVFREIFYILGSILPKRMDVDMDFSLGSPNLTGMVYGLLSAFPYGYRQRFDLRTDIDAEDVYAEGTIAIRGRILICLIIAALFRLLFDRNIIRLVITLLKKRKG